MSGFEVVGAVLGVLPLLLSGLEHYKQGLRLASNMVQYQQPIDNLVLGFRVYVSLYQDSCERLVRPLMLEQHEWETLYNDPGGPAWRDQELGDAIRNRLDRDFETYIDLAARLYRRLIKFAKQLSLDPGNDWKPTWMTGMSPTQSNFRQRFFRRSNKTWEGLKSGWKSGDLQQALDAIEHDLDMLSKLLHANERAAPARLEIRRRKTVMRWQNIRIAAKAMYGALAAHWQCPAEHRHSVVLRLESRHAAAVSPSIRFGVFMSWQETNSAPTELEWHELEVEPTQQQVMPGVTTASRTPQIVAPSGAKSKVQILIPQATPPSKVPIASAAQIGNLIDDLCLWQRSTLASSHDSKGFLQHQEWRHDIVGCKGRVSKSKPPYLLSLKDCVTGSALTGGQSPVGTSLRSPMAFPRGLSTKERYHFATVLASTVLQLAATPWLAEDELALEEIYLMDLQQREPTTAYPYVRRMFPPLSTNVSKPKTPLIQNTLVFALGVILLELAYGECLAQFKEPCDMDTQGNDLPHSEVQIAYRLLPDLHPREGPKYSDAARRCIKCDFSCSRASFEDADFQEQFYKGVVQPLVELNESLK